MSLASGCSWIFVQPPPPDYGRGRDLDCTTNRAAPVIDTIFTITNVISALYVAGQNNVTNKGASVGLGLSVAALWGMSAGYGYSNTSQCEEAKASMSGRYYSPAAVRPRPAALPPPPYAPPADDSSPGRSPQQQPDDDEPGAVHRKESSTIFQPGPRRLPE
jgi:hypothetical protein